MNNSQIDSRYRNLIHTIYINATMIIQIEVNTNPIAIKREVRQGDVV